MEKYSKLVKYSAAITNTIEEDGVKFYDLKISASIKGVVLFHAEPDDCDGLIRCLAGNPNLETYYPSTGNGHYGFKVKTDDQGHKMVEWSVGKFGDGNAGAMTTRTPYNKSFAKMLKSIPEMCT